MRNFDLKTVDSFGDEWTRFNQSALDKLEFEMLADAYFGLFPWDKLPHDAEGFDMGCGSGRWAKLIAPRVGKLHCIDPSSSALSVAASSLMDHRHVVFHQASVSDSILPPESQDFGYSLGVLHHVPDTKQAIKDCVRLLKPRAPFLLYLYYAFDNRPRWYKRLWQLSNILRRAVSVSPPMIKNAICDGLAAIFYFPLARLSLLLEKCGLSLPHLPLYNYRNVSFYTMRTDSRDRFGTPLEQRFTRDEIEKMMLESGLTDIVFSTKEPYWCAIGHKK
jgi:SAM-dependent methyltransferase